MLLLPLLLLLLLHGAHVHASVFPLVVNTWASSFTAATDAAYLALSPHDGPSSGSSALDAVQAGCEACETLQCDGTVGFGGSPDEDCETTLDALIMDGTSMRAGAVANLRRVRRAIAVARTVLDRTRHTLLAGDQALAFALQNGFVEEDLSTPASLGQCRIWRENHCQPNFRIGSSSSCEHHLSLDHPSSSSSSSSSSPPFSSSSTSSSFPLRSKAHDTLSLIAIHADGSMAAGTTTNGATHKIPGRVGDGPIVGSGSYVDGQVGGCGATGDGDILMLFLPCYQAVESLRRGLSPLHAARDAVARITKRYPDVQVGIVVVSAKGEHAAAAAGWTFTYSYRGGTMKQTEVVTVQPDVDRSEL